MVVTGHHPRPPTIPNRAGNDRRGFNLIEAAIVLGVVGLVIGGIWVAAAAVSESRKQAKIAHDVGYLTSQLMTKLNNVPPPTGVYSSNLVPYIAKTQLLPPDWAVNASEDLISFGDLGISASLYGTSSPSPGIIDIRFAVSYGTTPITLAKTLRRQRSRCVNFGNGFDTPSLAQLRGDVIYLAFSVVDSDGNYPRDPCNDPANVGALDSERSLDASARFLP